MSAADEILDAAVASGRPGEMAAAGREGVTALRGLAGSAYSLYAAAALRIAGGIHIFLAEDRDAAAYLAGDLDALLGEGAAMFFPTGYKRSVRFGQEDPSGLVQRTAALEAIRNYGGGRLVICTYPEALAEKVAAREQLTAATLTVSAGERITLTSLEEIVADMGFERVDFVYEPGQYSVRGGIFDVFSYSDNRPYRIDFFGDEIDSVRGFSVADQLSTERLQSVSIVPDMRRASAGAERVALTRFAEDFTLWADGMDYALRRVDDLRRKLLAESDRPDEAAALVTSRKDLLSSLEGRRVFVRRGNAAGLPEAGSIAFDTSPQPSFNKQYDLLAEDIRRHSAEGYTTYILSENRVQTERLQNIFASIPGGPVDFRPLALTLHEGFTDNGLRLSLYTDHQIFERYHRYAVRGGLDRSRSMTVAELGELKQGDYVVHIDHGVGRFGGLVKTVENGREHEAVKLVYRDGDVLLVNVHSLHRISRYKDKDSDMPPRIYKLGSGVWQRMKNAAKSAVKDIARELVALYAERRAGGGFAFSPDGYLQHELEASFSYEETTDQQRAMEFVKHDMEAREPMDRLICGDVGFGKTEVAVRAAFKAVCDSKQVAVLVPTTILALQHYRTFSERLRGFPVRVEMLSRARSAKETREVLADLAAGKVDILVGTHKILGRDVKFKDLGLLVIDEEQKFGVTSKERLRQLSVHVDTLTMTATPIPRTLQFSLMGARDLSVIATPPANRQPIVTESHTFDEEIIREAVDFELARGGQVYFVHNRVEDIERIADLVRRVSPGARVAVGHGQMNAQQLEKLIMDFIYNEFDVLVATTIIENGIDIPNANTIIIDDAQNFGLSDLHQLRGRVGRSDRKSYCYLLSPPDELLSSEARRRLRAIEEFSDLGAGFNIAMQDLDIRGAGNLLGAEQSGFIADMGFETYQRILAEAVSELRAEGVDTGEITREGLPAESPSYITDSQVETDAEALLPDSYVGQGTEKLRLYRMLDNMTTEEELVKFEAELTDRFGRMPEAALRLLDVVRLRWKAVELGFERVKVKNGLMLLWFPSDTSSAYYKSPLYMALLRHAAEHSAKFVIKQNNNKVYLTVRDVKDMAGAVRTLSELSEAVRPARSAQGRDNS